MKALLFSYVEYKISQWAPNSNTDLLGHKSFIYFSINLKIIIRLLGRLMAATVENSAIFQRLIPESPLNTPKPSDSYGRNIGHV